MNDFISLIIATVSLVSVFVHYESKYSELVSVKSTIDNKEYLVRSREDKQEAANLLSKIRIKLEKLLKVLKANYGEDKRVLRLSRKCNFNKINESLSTSKHTSYSVNKGEKIVFCIRRKDENEKLVKLNTMLFVAIHEIAHIMTVSVGHTEEFWKNMKFLLKVAIKHKIYRKQDFKKTPEDYCGMTITDSPL